MAREAEATYVIEQRRLCYAGTIGATRRWHPLADPMSGGVEVYATRREAMARIRDIEGAPYELAHGEYARPDLRVRAYRR